MSTAGKWIIGIAVTFAGIGFLVLAMSVFMLATAVTTSTSDSYEQSYGGSSAGRVGLIELSEPITDAEDVIRQLRKYRRRSSVKAIVLRLDSPGGGVVPSHEIYREVLRTRQLGTPVVVSMGSVAASGAYYIACGASYVVSNPGTLTGSIGVISQFADFSELMENVGIHSTTIKSGKFKDTGSPTRPMQEQEKLQLQNTIDNVYEQFVSVVVKGRHLPRDSVLALADGRVFTGQQALGFGLVDTLGTLHTAVIVAGNLGKMQGEPRVVREEEVPNALDYLLGAKARKELEGLQTRLQQGSPLQYRLLY
ncbi:signal peptide peptidase SppA [bacterium]|nr:signal peptide peptidase SppA [bacterium]